jgi:light-regulated signal transduction histidine kinase (bacteriophytochrome)
LLPAFEPAPIFLGNGISISKKIAELMSGKIGVNSQEGVGSEF